MKKKVYKLIRLDNIGQTKPKNNEHIVLTMQFHTGSRYAYSGQTKRECLDKFHKAFGNMKGFVKIEWNIEEI